MKKTQMEEELLPLIPTSWHSEMKYFTEEEFENKILGKPGYLHQT